MPDTPVSNNDVFVRTQTKFGGAFSSNQGVLTLTGATDADPFAVAGLTPILAQNFLLDFSQVISRIYEVCNGAPLPSVYNLAGQSSGNIAIKRIVGPHEIMTPFLQSYGDICNTAQNAIALTPRINCNPDRSSPGAEEPLTFGMFSVQLLGLGAGIDVQDLLTALNLRLRFERLEIFDEFDQGPSGGGGGGGGGGGSSGPTGPAG